MRTALYLRLAATPDPSYKEDDEFARLRALATQERWRIIHEYLDVAGGASDELHRLLSDAHAGRFDLVLCPSLDQFAPGGLSVALRQLAQLRRYDIAFHSVAEPMISTVPGAESSWAAALETLAAHDARHRSRRVQAGIRRTQRLGRRTGRPRISLAVRKEILRLRFEEGRSVRATARLLGVSRGTVVKYQDRPADELLELLPGRAD